VSSRKSKSSRIGDDRAAGADPRLKFWEWRGLTREVARYRAILLTSGVWQLAVDCTGLCTADCTGLHRALHQPSFLDVFWPAVTRLGGSTRL